MAAQKLQYPGAHGLTSGTDSDKSTVVRRFNPHGLYIVGAVWRRVRVMCVSSVVGVWSLQ